MDKIDKIKELAELIDFPPYDGFPDIELYMDQVIDFLSRSQTSLRDDDKLSSAMVNNYIKAEILPRAHGKKYSREHLAHLAVIIRLKQVLSVKDTGMLIKVNKLGKTDEEFFNSFRGILQNAAENIASDVSDSDEKLADVAMDLAVHSYLYKIASEYVLDLVADYYWEKTEKPEGGEKKENGEKRDKAKK